MQSAIFLAWVTSLVLALAQTERVTPPDELAPAIAAAAEAHPLVGHDGHARMAATLTALAWTESRFQLDAVGDKGQSVSAWQVSRHWKPPSDVAGQAKLAARLVTESFRSCSDHELNAKLSWYTAGGAGCPDAGARASSWRMRLAKRLLHDHPPPQIDQRLE